MSPTPAAPDFRDYRPELRERYDAAGLFEGTPLWRAVLDAGTVEPDRIAVLDAGRGLTHAELDRASAARAAGFAALFSPGETVVLQLPNTAEFAVTLLGLLRAGVVPVMALPAHRITEIAHLARTSAAVGYVCTDTRGGFDYRELGTELRRRVPGVRRILVDGDPGPHLPLPTDVHVDGAEPEVDTARPALLLISGGTTGAPKLIPRTHDDYLYNVRRASAVCELGREDVYLVALPAAHNFPLACPGLLGALLTGARVVFTEDPSPDAALDLIERHAVTVTALVPALAQLWTAARAWEPADVSGLRLLQVGGAKLAEPDARAAQLAFPGALQQVFGMAEGLINLTRIGADPDTVATTQGIPMSEYDELRVVDEDGAAVPPGEPGELLTRGPYTIRGYFHAASAAGPSDAGAGAINHRSFTPDGFYRSGDQVRIRADGSVEYVSRLKETIVRGGENIFPDDIEEALLAHPSVLEAGLVGLADPVLGERTCAVLVTHGGTLTLAQVRDFLAAQGLAAFKLPDRVVIIDDLPLTAVGKVDRKALRARLG
jgi:mycobactin salicyl-AMP ligase